MGDFTGSDYTKKEHFRCQLITWGEAARMSRELARMVHASKFEPEIIVAIGRGGEEEVMYLRGWYVITCCSAT